MIKEVTYKEPSGYFNEAMRAAVNMTGNTA